MKRTTSRILRMLLCYLLFCGFVWAFLTVQTRSHNRLSHEPAAMAQLVCHNETVMLHLPDQSYQWKLPQLDCSGCGSQHCRMQHGIVPSAPGRF
ncbi:MAG: hypothetical protein ACLUOF_07785 [Ruminococcus sp.]